MSTPEKKSDAEHMTGASGQRWEPADEGVVVEAPGQSPPGSDAPPRRHADAPGPAPTRPGPNREPEEEAPRS